MVAGSSFFRAAREYAKQHVTSSQHSSFSVKNPLPLPLPPPPRAAPCCPASPMLEGLCSIQLIQMSSHVN